MESEQLVDIDPVISHLESGTTLLTPGLRLARALSSAWLAKILQRDTVARAPAIQPVDAWLESRWREFAESGALPMGRLLSRMEERLLWSEIIEADTRRRQNFQLIQSGSAADFAMASREALLFFASDPDAASLASQFHFDQDCAVFAGWRKTFEARLHREGWVTRGDCYHQLLSLPRPAQRPAVVLAHCLELPPLTWRVIAHIADAHVVPGENDRSRAPGLRLKGARYINRKTELSAAAKWAADRYRSGEGTTAIVLLDMHQDRNLLEYFLRQQFDCLDARYNDLPVNFSTGMPLAETPLFRDALLALRVGREPISREEALALLRSPFLLEPDFGESTEGLALSALLTDQGTPSFEPADLAHLAAVAAEGSLLARQLGAIRADRSGSGSKNLGLWSDDIRSRLRAWSWPGRTPLDSIEFQQLEKLEQSFDTLARLAPIVGDVSIQQAVQLWRRCLEDMVFQPKTPFIAVQVLGQQEALGLSFDAIRVVGMLAGALPRTPRLLPFIPAAIQKQLGLPNASSEGQLKSAVALLNSWLRTHGEVSASCCRQEDGVDQLPSPLFQIEEDVASDQSANRVLAALLPAGASGEQVDDSLAPLDGSDLIPYGGGAGVLKNQSECPFRAWVTHRLGPSVVSTTVFGLTASERGSLVHDALHDLWKWLKTQDQLLLTDENALNTQISSTVATAIGLAQHKAERRHQNLRKRVGSACLDMEAERLGILLTEWLAVEARRTEPFTVVEGESTHRLAIGPLELSLRPDRVDRLADGRRLVIDYKTGTHSAQTWLGERPSEPQLPIYALLDDQVEGIAFARVKKDDSAFVALGENLGLGGKEKPLLEQLTRSEVAAVSWGELRTWWRSVLEGLAYAYGAGEAQVDPTTHACRFCALSAVCRIGVVELADTDTEGGCSAQTEEGL